MMMVILLILAAIVIIFLVNSYQNKYQSFQGVVFNALVILLLLFVLISVTYVYNTSDPDLKTFKGVVDFSKSYFSWTMGFFGTAGNTVGYVVNQDWRGNSTDSK